MIRLWVVRHGETSWSAAGRHTGRTDVKLTDRGEREATLLRKRLSTQRFAMVLTSPMLRARETCRIVGYEESAVIDERLLEWDYGAYEGLTTAEIQEKCTGWNLWTDGVLAGETIEQVAARVEQVIDLVRTAVGDVVLFGHGHSLRVLAAHWLGLPPAHGRLLTLDASSVSVLGYEREQQVIRHWNELCHLHSG